MIKGEINSNWKRLSRKKIYFNKVFFQQCGIFNDEKMKWAIICSRMFYCILCNLTRKFFVSHSNMSQFIILKFQNTIYINFSCFLINQIEKINKNDVKYINRFLWTSKFKSMALNVVTQIDWVLISFIHLINSKILVIWVERHNRF